MSLSKKLRASLLLALIAGLFLSSCGASVQTQPFTENQPAGALRNVVAFQTGSLYDQPVDPSGKMLLSAWLDPDGSDLDQYIWDNFTLQTSETITDIQWYGVYDPLKFGAGGPVLDFSVSIYPSIPAGTEPAIANPPLVQYQIDGNAGETQIGMIGTAPLYVYSFTLPTPFAASAGAKYWLQIEASQKGTTPDWCLAAGAGGDASHFQRGTGAGGDILYRTAPGDAAFTLLGPVPEVPTPTDTPTDVVIVTDTPTDTSTPTDTATSPATDTPTATVTDTATSIASDTQTPTNTPTDTPTVIPSITPTDTPTSLATNTPTDTPTSTATEMPTFTPTPTPLSNTPGKVTGGGVIGSGQESIHATFGFVVSYREGDPQPKGNFIYQDHTIKFKLQAASFDLLVVENNHIWISGKGTLNDGQEVTFKVEVELPNTHDHPAVFSISIPEIDDYFVSAPFSGGNITIH